MATKAWLTNGSSTGRVETDDAEVLAYLNGLPEPGDVDTRSDAWAVETGPGAYDVSRPALDEALALANS